ncbi:hypothetical protein C8R43DRAFT_999151 [Mycena crocata]|nr:hypothetical protein C8R43DRAFT_999151 [Mycena crocata]
MAQKHISKSSVTNDDVVLRLHCLSATTNGLQLDRSYRTKSQRDGLEDHFGKNPQLTDSFVSVAQALTTISAPKPGKDNIAIMFGLAGSVVRVFCAQNGGPSANKLINHISAVWQVVQSIHQVAQVLPVDSRIASSPRPVASGEKDLMNTLADSVYTFVKRKALHRTSKRLPAISMLHRASNDTTILSAEDKELIQILFDAATAARDSINFLANRAATSNSHPQLPRVDFATTGDWLDFRSAIRILRDLTNGSNFPSIATRVQNWADQTLICKQMRNVLLLIGFKHTVSFSAFDVQKSVKKILKVEVAYAALCALAVSPRRNEFIERKLIVHYVETPKALPIEVHVDAIQDGWYPHSMTKEEAMQKMLKMMHKGKVTTTVHSEVQLVAWMAQHAQIDFPEMAVIPYVTCSKLHCFACYIWFGCFAKLQVHGLPSIHHDGSDGKLHPGWVPPLMGIPYQQQMNNLFVDEIENYFPKQSHSKEGSASTTATDPQIYTSSVGSDYERVRNRRARSNA